MGNETIYQIKVTGIVTREVEDRLLNVIKEAFSHNFMGSMGVREPISEIEDWSVTRVKMSEEVLQSMATCRPRGQCIYESYLNSGHGDRIDRAMKMRLRERLKIGEERDDHDPGLDDWIEVDGPGIWKGIKAWFRKEPENGEEKTDNG